MAKVKTIPPQWARLHRQSLRALLREEARLLLGLRATVVAATSAARGGGPARIVEAAALLAAAVERAILLGRRNAKLAAHLTLAQQLKLAAEEDDWLPPGEELVGEDDEDRRWAFWVGASLAKRFRGLAFELLEDGAPTRQAVSGATKKLGGRLPVIATTETSRAFNAEREAELKRYAMRLDEAAELGEQDLPQQPRTTTATAGTLLPFKWWNAAGDRRTCPRCEALDSTVLPLHVPWPEGPPGTIHPNCRCTEDVILMPVWTEWDIAA